MARYKKAAAAAVALTMAFSLFGCADGEPAETTVTTTTQATVEIKTDKLSEDDAQQVKDVADQLTGELENKTIKWLSFYDPFHASTSGNTKALSLELFEEKYGGEIEYYQTTWKDLPNELSNQILAGTGIDFIAGGDLDFFPRGVTNGMFMPVDDYIDYGSNFWSPVKNLNDMFVLNGKHYVIATNATAGQVVYYNRSTLDAYGLEDPAKLLEEGKWDWDMFKSYLLEFCNPDEGTYGLDGWFNEKPLMMTAGKPALEIRDGKLVDNFYDHDLERAMAFQRELYDIGLIVDKNLPEWNWKTHIEYIGEGKELFYISGLYEIGSDPKIWTKTFGEQEDVMFVPLPKDPKADAYYLPAGLEAYMMCRDAGNPEGVIKFMECILAANSDERTISINREKNKKDFGWSDEMLEMSDRINAMTLEHPVYDLTNGVSPDLNKLVDSGQTGVRAAFEGGDWASVRESLEIAARTYIDEFNSQLEAME